MKPKILIVDDEKPLRDTLARWFRPGYECLLAPDADAAPVTVNEAASLMMGLPLVSTFLITNVACLGLF